MKTNTQNSLDWFFATLLCALCLGLLHCSSTSSTTDTDDQEQEEEETTANESDFTPASGTASDGDQGAYGPWNLRLMIATSTDGSTWTRLGFLTDQGDVPCVIAKDGKLWVFYVIWRDADSTEGIYNTTVAAYSEDLTNWTFKRLNFTGSFPAGFTTNPVDPSVVLDQDGSTYRMYFTLGGEGVDAERGTFSATSTDLVNWTYEGERYVPDDDDALDPNVLWVGDHYEYFAGGLPENEGNHHATSTDGLTFTADDHILVMTNVSGQDIPVLFANGLKVGDTYKYYGFLNQAVGEEPQPDIRSFTFNSSDDTWTIDSSAVLSVDESSGEESTFVKDPGVSAHPDGESSGYVLIYVTAIP
ncbi:MAG: hypothetical protein HQM16_15565 [Deltaproteobacteria bacterium]|nr:hypothetical protein [Deltaproteobacteria bacterium]